MTAINGKQYNSSALSIFMRTIVIGVSITGLINKLIEHDPSRDDFIEIIKVLLPWVLIFVGAMAVKHVVQSIQPYISQQLQDRASSILMDYTFDKVMQLGLATF